MKETKLIRNIKCIEQDLENLKIQKNILLKENIKLKKQLQKCENKNQKEREYFTKYRTLYMKYKHQQNNFEKITNQYKEVIRLLQAEIIQNASNEELFEKVEKLNKLGV